MCSRWSSLSLTHSCVQSVVILVIDTFLCAVGGHPCHWHIPVCSRWSPLSLTHSCVQSVVTLVIDTFLCAVGGHPCHWHIPVSSRRSPLSLTHVCTVLGMLMFVKYCVYMYSVFSVASVSGHLAVHQTTAESCPQTGCLPTGRAACHRIQGLFGQVMLWCRQATANRQSCYIFIATE